jgi:hypothetical protein
MRRDRRETPRGEVRTERKTEETLRRDKGETGGEA